MKPMKIMMAAVSTLFLFVLAGCAVKVPPPDQQLALATDAISQAESTGAYELAPVELKSARDKLSQAKAAMEQEDNARARRLAEAALIDANLAEIKSRSAKSQKMVEELRESIRVLQEEMSRKSGP